MRKQKAKIKKLKKNKKQLIKNIITKGWISLAVLIISLAILSSLFRALTPFAKHYKPQLEHYLSSSLGTDVSIEDMQTGWYWFEPVIKLSNISFKQKSKTTPSLSSITVGFNLFTSLLNWQLQPGILFINKAHFDVYQDGASWRVNGLNLESLNKSSKTKDNLDNIISWLALQQHLKLKNISFSIHFKDGTVIPIDKLNLKVNNHEGHYKAKGKAILKQTQASQFNILADFSFEPSNPRLTTGQFFISLNDILPAQWQAFFPSHLRRFSGGQANLKLWLDIKNGKLTNIQSQAELKRLALNFPNKKEHQLIQYISANIAFIPKDDDWALTADNVHLHVSGTRWPVNKLRLSYDSEKQTYSFGIKEVVLGSLLPEVEHWYKPSQQLKLLNPEGRLHDAQLAIKDNKIQYIITKFDGLGWYPWKGLPGAKNIEGVLYWQPDQGELHIDSNNILLRMKNLPNQAFSIANAQINWKKLSHGLRVVIDNFVLSSPKLTISSQATLDDVSAHSINYLNVKTDFSLKDLETWLAYLPKKGMKPKLLNWLQQDIRKIGKVDGSLTVKGKPSEFPFDDSDGEFKINSYLSDVSLRFKNEWSFVNDINAFLRVNKRTLEADVVHADIGGVILKKLNLSINDIGLDKERLLIHGIIKDSAQKMMNFVMKSPLSQRLSALKMLKIKGLLDLDLSLDFPLYIDAQGNQAKGTILFSDNKVEFQHSLGQLDLVNLQGKLEFNQEGVVDSTFKAQALGYPFSMSLKSIKKPKHGTLVDVSSHITVEELKKRYQSPLFNYMEGNTALNTQLSITSDPNDLDSMKIMSSLKGLHINLPSPVGKNAKETVNLTGNIEFNPKKALHLVMNYGDRISSNIWFKYNNQALTLESGEIRLGSGKALIPNTPGLRVIGGLERLNIDDWIKIGKASSDSGKSGALLSYLNFIDLVFKKAIIFNKDWKDLKIKATRANSNLWSIWINQAIINAKLTYNSIENSLKGVFDKLNLDFINTSSSLNQKNNIHPNNIPNISFKIKNLLWKKYYLGEGDIKGHLRDDQWLIDKATLSTPGYYLSMTGKWTQNDSLNNTSLKCSLNIANLERSLEKFGIDPVVKARKGNVNIIGGWKGSYFDFSLASLEANMDITLKNGRITNLSKETEQKLGLGKLLSILSLQTIPRRLTLDFSDLSEKGYTFDTFKGKFKIKDGVMHTNNSYIDGPVAYASMKGMLNLEKRLYDLHLKISPHITASLPIVATIAGGPIAGIATWVISKIINKGVHKISAYTYKVSGPWSDPVVQQIDLIKRKE